MGCQTSGYPTLNQKQNKTKQNVYPNYTQTKFEKMEKRKCVHGKPDVAAALGRMGFGLARWQVWVISFILIGKQGCKQPELAIGFTNKCRFLAPGPVYGCSEHLQFILRQIEHQMFSYVQAIDIYFVP